MMVERDAYTVLQVRPEADQAVVHAAYRALARRHHPDGDTPAIDKMIELNRAYERVRNEDRRTAYEQERRRPVAVGPGSTSQPYDSWDNRSSGMASSAAPAVAPSQGDTIDFGQYIGWRIADIARHDPDYLRWLSRHSTGIRYLKVIAQCFPGESLGRSTNALR